MKFGLIFLLLLVAIATFAWLFRFDTAINNAGGIVVTDRWLGKVYYCGSSECQPIYPK